MKDWPHRMEKHGIWIFPLLALLIYWPTRHAGFTHDFTGWFERYQLYGVEGIRHCFGYHRLQHVMHLFHFLLFKVAGGTSWIWYLVYSLLFGLTAHVVFHLCTSISNFVQYKDRWIGLMASAAFLIHPYQTTAVVWKVCFHYLLTTFFIVLIVNYTLKWIEKPDKWKIRLIYIAYILSLFTHELTISIPLMTTVLAVVLWINGHALRKKMWYVLVLPQFLILPLYFSLTPLLLLDTGKDQLLTEHHIQPAKQATAVYQYASKHALFSRYWSHQAKEKWQRLLARTDVAYTLVLLSILLVIFFFYSYRLLPSQWKFTGLCLLFFTAAIGPFTSAYVAYILYTTNDMYGYAASTFLLMGLVCLIRMLPFRVSQVVFALYVFLSLVFLGKTIYYWQQSGQVMKSLLTDYHWYDRDKVYVLLSVDNYKGINMLNSTDPSMLDDHLLVHSGEKTKSNIVDILQFNMARPEDGASVVVHSPDSLSVKFNQWGNWFWKNGIGAGNYETDKFKVTIRLPYYHLKRKQIEAGETYIIQNGMKWEEVEEWRTAPSK